ncbi:cold shock domain-containing protein [Sphingomonas sp. G124]|uniref:Cold shock domain-containing protein n=1 Tax=Sphingomonas cremea TaxID=2904799 RepID=A0A9X1QM82_9SPHN|nr:cold shock domain-containing protein [Sphingomonas cremea]MCF2514503.1 cold shock domain-containing protein [Sphingomonas cremea]
MKYFGTVKSFDTDTGTGSLKPETGGDELMFERSAISWDAPKAPTVGQRLSYDKGTLNSQPCAINLGRI